MLDKHQHESTKHGSENRSTHACAHLLRAGDLNSPRARQPSRHSPRNTRGYRHASRSPGGGGPDHPRGGNPGRIARGGGGKLRRDTRPGRLPAEVLVVQARVARALEGARHPRVLVGELPDDQAHALGQRQARAHDGHVVARLLRDRGGVGGQRHADVELGDGDLDAEADEAVEHGHEALHAGRPADRHVALEPDAVDARGRVLHQAHNVQRRVRLGAVELKAEVVVVELRLRVCRRRRAEGDGDEVGAQGGKEDAVPKGSVTVVEGLVDYVPGVARAGEVADNVRDVGLDDSCEGVPRPCSCGNWVLWSDTGPA